MSGPIICIIMLLRCPYQSHSGLQAWQRCDGTFLVTVRVMLYDIDLDM